MKILKQIICIIALLYCITSLFMSPTDLLSQSKQLSFKFDQILLKDALDYIIKQYSIPITYQDNQIENIKISVQCTNCNVEDAMNSVLKGTLFIWKRIGSQYILLKEKNNLKTKISGNNTIKGFIRNRANGETISYVNIVIDKTTLGAMSDENGYYVISKIPGGSFTIKAMMMGYAIQEKNVRVYDGQTITLDFELEESVIQGETIIKTAEREKFERQIEPSKIQISRREIEAAPAFVEADLFRSLQMLPGVITQSDFSSALYIRGGNPSENIILLDDVRIYNPYHFGGVFSTFNTDAIKNVDVSLGGFPARYGNAISSVISVTNKDGNSKEYEGRGSISLLSSKLVLEGPIPNGSVLISARRTYFDFIYNQFIRPRSSDPDFRFPYYFYDFHGKINYSFSENSKLTLSGFYGNDILYVENDRETWDSNIQQYRVTGQDKTDVQFGNYSTTLKWQYIFNPRLFSEFIVAKSRFRASSDGDYEDEKLDALDTIEDYTLKNDITYFLSDNHELKLGLDYQQLRFKILFRINDVKLMDYSRKANFFSSYIQDDWKVTPLLNIQSGVRLTYYDLGKYYRFDPRLSARYRYQHNINLKASIGIYHQYFYTFNPEDIDFLNYIRLIDLWFPVDNRYKPIRAIHYIGGFEYMLNDDYLLSIEGYYKDYDNLLDMNEIGDKGQDDDFLNGWGYATGLEFLLKKQRGNVTGWVGYTLAFTERTIETARASHFLKDKSYNKEYQTFPPSYDRRHALTIVASYKSSERWKFNTRFTYCSGLPETPTLGWKKMYEIGDTPQEIIAENIPDKAPKNSKRLPPYIRLDVSLMRTYKFKHWSLQPFLQIINLTNHHNIFLYNYDLELEYDSYGNVKPPRRQGTPMFPFIPTIGVNFEF